MDTTGSAYEREPGVAPVKILTRRGMKNRAKRGIFEDPAGLDPTDFSTSSPLAQQRRRHKPPTTTPTGLLN